MIQRLVEKFLANPANLRMGAGKLSRRWRVSEENVRDARRKAQDLLRGNDEAVTSNYIADLETNVANFRENVETGEAICNFKTPVRIKTKEDLIALGMLDLDNFDIISYEVTTWEGYRKDKVVDLKWDNGSPTGSVQDKGKMITETLYRVNVKLRRRKLITDPLLQAEVVKEAVLKSLADSKGGFETEPLYQSAGIPGTTKGSSSKVLIVVTSDEHVAAANLEDDLYNIPYNKTEYALRKIRIVEEIRSMVALHGKFDTLINITLGDDLDGWSGGTTRAGEPGHAHILPQNMSNREAVETYVRTNNTYWDMIMQLDPAYIYEKHDVVNSNHGGKGLDHIANLGVEIYLEAKHPRIKCNYITKLLGHIELGKHNLVLTHGKDESYRKKPMPLNLNADTEVFIKQYMDYNGLSEGNTHLIKGDLHQWNWNSGKFFDYINVGSLYGSSGWVQANYGLSKPSFAIGYLDHLTDEFNLRPVYINPFSES